jgi:hypothetical protein
MLMAGTPGYAEKLTLPDGSPYVSPRQLSGSPAHVPRPEFARDVNDALASIPDAVHDGLAGEGYRISTGFRLVDMFVGMINERPRGWPAGTTWRNVGGVFTEWTGERVIALAEWRHDEYQGHKLVPVENPAGVLREEVGHAVYDWFQRGGFLGPFRQAYDREAAVARADTQASQLLEYYLQQGDAGAEEAFANLFAVEHGGGPAPLLIPHLRQWFPNTLREIQELLK